MANTLSTESNRRKYLQANLDFVLRHKLVAEKICSVDRSDLKTIDNPYGSDPTVVVQALAGTYAVADYTITDSTLTVVDEFIVGEHIFDFEKVVNNFDLFANRVDTHAYKVAEAIDKYVVNNLCEDGTGTYTTPSGGFTTAANINVIMSNLLGKVASYADLQNGMFLVIEPTDVPGFVQAQATNGYSFADSALKNGFMGNYMGIDIYVVKASTFADGTAGAAGVGSQTYSNSGHRVFGIKGVSTYASPRGVQFDEKKVSGKTGMEIVTYGYVGFKLWATKTALIVDITLTA